MRIVNDSAGRICVWLGACAACSGLLFLFGPWGAVLVVCVLGTVTVWRNL
jgi:hypothetical protein